MFKKFLTACLISAATLLPSCSRVATLDSGYYLYKDENAHSRLMITMDGRAVYTTPTPDNQTGLLFECKKGDRVKRLYTGYINNDKAIDFVIVTGKDISPFHGFRYGAIFEKDKDKLRERLEALAEEGARIFLGGNERVSKPILLKDSLKK